MQSVNLMRFPAGQVARHFPTCSLQGPVKQNVVVVVVVVAVAVAVAVVVVGVVVVSCVLLL
jgi:hypothetical protein